MSSTLLRLARLGLIAALFISLGGHWALLQSYAWGRMLVAYSQNGSVKEAVAKTFDGQHPCDLCKALGDARKDKGKAEYVTIKKMEMIHETARALIYWTGRSEKLMLVDWTAVTLVAEPSVPPPRAA